MIISDVGDDSVDYLKTDAKKEVKEVKEARIDAQLDEVMEEKVKSLKIEDVAHFTGANDSFMDAKKPF
ncbi:hypothetical protein L6452_35446 [Arctium lappa]|uniref:Uncharacterized protein n=2 Tax=Arctium lappa TaxID=4217 RepID=A0ACB8Y6G7_ARCLA|nr:hypothetical protein L6452_35439 [Arctium lappa]KAI3680673.1 hypothetical protein L6452_35446 [Arctium lappa]